jgi:hypothetical protein
MNARALPKGDSESVSRQGTLDGIVAVLPQVLPLTNAGLLDHIIELVVCEDEVCCFCSVACHRSMVDAPPEALMEVVQVRRMCHQRSMELVVATCVVPHCTKPLIGTTLCHSRSPHNWTCDDSLPCACHNLISYYFYVGISTGGPRTSPSPYHILPAFIVRH